MSEKENRPTFPVSVVLQCEECGKEFEVKRNCRTQEKASNYEKWVKEHVSTCPRCDFKNKRTYEHLWDDIERCPEITGSSTKEIVYAESRRMDYFFDNREWITYLDFRIVKNCIKKCLALSDSEIQRVAKLLKIPGCDQNEMRNGVTAALIMSEVGKDKYFLACAYLSDAKDVVDFLDGKMVDFRRADLEAGWYF